MLLCAYYMLTSVAIGSKMSSARQRVDLPLLQFSMFLHPQAAAERGPEGLICNVAAHLGCVSFLIKALRNA
jgi:hypothetical protein